MKEENQVNNTENIIIRKYEQKDLSDLIRIWNQVVEDKESGKIYGFYILHPNNIGRCGHICNASYAVDREARGLHIGEKLVKDCLVQGKAHGFGVLQFNAVVASNIHARHLYERLGFEQLGTIPGGFRMKDGTYEDICPYYHVL